MPRGTGLMPVCPELPDALPDDRFVMFFF